MSDNFGTIGDLNKLRGSSKPTGLPQWLLDQMSANTSVDEGGGQRTEYSFNQNPLGGFKGKDGKYYVQVGNNKLKDPSKVVSDPEMGDITEASNVNDLLPDGINYAMLAAVLGAGALGTVAGLGAEAGGGAAAAGGGAAEGAAGAGGAAAGGSGLTPLTGVTLAPETAIGTLGEVGGGAAAAGGAAGGGGGLAALGGSAGSGLTPLTGVSLAPETSIGTVGSVGGAAGGGGSLLSQAGNALASNPGQAARLGLGLAALGGAAHNSSGTAAGTTDAGSIIEQMANANRVDQNTPLGSRHWAQDPATGRWTVNDTMNPAEQSNFENVQSLNASGTDFSKQFLAKLLAAPPPPTAGHSFTVNGRTIGG
jgi:hypothetical protein